jgi:hypothetical protein
VAEEDKENSPESLPVVTVKIKGSPPQDVAYANATYVFANGMDFTIAFMRVPNMTDEDLQEARNTGQISAPIVTAVTLPASAIAGLVATLNNYLKPSALRPCRPSTSSRQAPPPRHLTHNTRRKSLSIR